MIDSIQGIHHVTSMGKDAARIDRFFRQVLGLRRVKQTVNFDAPDVYHLYYANGLAEPGSVMTYFPFPAIAPGQPGAGEVATTIFSVPEGSLSFWRRRLMDHSVPGVESVERFGVAWLRFTGSEGDSFALVERADDRRRPWDGVDIGAEHAIRGFAGASLRLNDEGPTRELLEFMGYRLEGRENSVTRLVHPGGNGADLIDLELDPAAAAARQGSGSVHHIAFAVPAARLLEVREALVGEGFRVTPQIDRNYFISLYFRTPGGVLFEIATNEPGFAADEPMGELGSSLKLPPQHAHLRPYLEAHLPPLEE